ncbi:glycosyltransferase family 4 protein [Pseudoalteromonas piscicida]|uniref:glycosyltransferase family 4 protein n=1 Tax=Pseudoalteromonas piscicida TaxID=43662 RepID=UPI001D0A863A|nr:glycosyltransferase family 4 protein [Pseudoalteromonas piscicida]UDM62770.1 glycosyltransferase family 4 protein [Pseudoalteromonas piscicida]
MRIALLPDDYLPSSTLVHAKMFHELAHELMRLGHEVVVITPGLPHQETRLQKEHFDGVEVWRFRAGTRRGVGKVKRAINESLLSLCAWIAIKREVKEAPFDVCVNYSPTIFFGLLASKMRKMYGTYVYLVLRDMFPQWIIDQEIIKRDSLIAKYFRYFEHLNYSASDKIGLMSNANLSYFTSINPQYGNVEVLHNWAKVSPSQFDELSLDIRKAYNLFGKVIFFYGGNIGHAQDMANIMRLARSLFEQNNAHFFIVGQGDEFELVDSLIKQWNLSNVTLLPSVSQEQYKELLTQVDVGLFSLAKNHSCHNFPGKLLGYMLQGLPVLGSVNEGNDLIDYINESKAGFIYKNGEDGEFVRGALALLNNGSLRKSMGNYSFELLKKSFSVEQAAKQILCASECLK